MPNSSVNQTRLVEVYTRTKKKEPFTKAWLDARDVPEHGVQEIPKPEELRGRGGAWFQIGGLQMHVGVDLEPSPKSKRHICFLVEDIAAAKTKVQSAGIAIEEESVAEGLFRFFIRDPAGNRIEIGQRI